MNKQTDYKDKERLEKDKGKKRERDASYRSKHLQEEKIYGEKYRAANKKQIAKKAVAWRKKNAVRLRAKKVAIYAANKDAILKARDKWRAENPDKVRAASRIHAHNRRARIKGNGGKLSRGIALKLFSLQKERCAICRTRLKKTGNHIDHIVPLSRGGKNEDSNVQLTCPTCNLKKNDKDPIQFMQELGYLL